ncbi:RloB domain-containing protein [Paenibacillus albidus]|uniref:RloB domain-containing protein n=1 Tax=Paenibacillus albidus TaxID=2041023 RepID=UPI001BE6F1D8|nr:RloB domain-containing protein [Paenibacillus albidus]MBT2289024.1 RloB domain-containing protein [Paenibacillus albidus]
MPAKKTNRKYYFSVEGETEKWYLEWIKQLMNNDPSAAHTVTIDCKKEKNPLKRAKSLTILDKTVITHWFDYESAEDIHARQFKETLDALKETSTFKKQIKYQLGYSNFTFELWMVLHKRDCNTALAHRRQYLKWINSAFGESFAELSDYKEEANFKRVLNKISLDDVQAAIVRAKKIMKRNHEAGLTLHEYKGYRYYKENPSLLVHESIENMLKDCKLI